MRSKVVFVVLLGVVGGFAFEALHDSMTEPELAYYFHTSDRSALPAYDVVYLPKVQPNDFGSIEYSFDAFDTPIKLKLKRNSHFLGLNFTTYLVDDDYSTILPDSDHLQNCHFIHEEGSIAAAISSCDSQSMQGLVFLNDTTLEIHPLTDRLQTLIQEPLLFVSPTATPHIIKRAVPITYKDDHLPLISNHVLLREALSTPTTAPLTVEIALFFDEPAYKIFSPFFHNDNKKLEEMLLAYINGVQALYHHPSLGTSIDLVLVRMEIFRKQPKTMPHYNGERSKLLDSFCAYQSDQNPRGDENSKHWDMALYVSGLDFYAYENGRKSGVTMGLATVGGVCLNQYNCLIAELGTTNVFGKPYPSAGFTSVYILAHEIGHNLGMHHDSVGNSCSKEGYVMSPSRGTNGETTWSTCSAEIAANLGWAKCLQDSSKPRKGLDHSRFLDSPGQVFTAKRQCEILLRDEDAVVSPHQDLKTICYSLQCKTPHRSGYYFAGPALEGTQCGNKKYCYGGGCVQKAPASSINVVRGGWGPWKETQCQSGCLEKSRGFAMKRRQCNNPIPKNTDKGCEGSNIEFGTCKDNKICANKRTSVLDYASRKCREFAKFLPELDPIGGGLQAPHEDSRVWVGCAIFCRHATSGGYYTPRLELNDLGVSPYFPDGSWCHKQNDLNYYCLHHHCLPENFRFTKNWNEIAEDVPFSQNAPPEAGIPAGVKNYFSLDSQGRPVKTVFKQHEIDDPDDDEWEIDDYVIVPGLKDRHD